MQPCLYVWVDGKQSGARLHFIYHCCVAVNLHHCLSMTISLLVGLHLLFALVLFCCMCFRLINHSNTVVSLYNAILWASCHPIFWRLLNWKCWKSKIVIELRNGRRDAPIVVVMSRDETETNTQSFSLLDAWRYHLYYGLITSVSLLPQSISPPEIWPTTRKTVIGGDGSVLYPGY